MCRNSNDQYDVRKPTPFMAPFSNVPVTKNDLERRERKNQRLKNIGVNPKRIDGDESENPYRVQAMTYINRDEDVPRELIGRIKEYDIRHKIDPRK